MKISFFIFVQGTQENCKYVPMTFCRLAEKPTKKSSKTWILFKTIWFQTYFQLLKLPTKQKINGLSHWKPLLLFFFFFFTKFVCLLFCVKASLPHLKLAKIGEAWLKKKKKEKQVYRRRKWLIPGKVSGVFLYESKWYWGIFVSFTCNLPSLTTTTTLFNEGNVKSKNYYWWLSCLHNGPP